MLSEGRGAGYAVAVVLTLWVAGAGWALSSLDNDSATPAEAGEGSASTEAAETTEVRLPTEVVFGAAQATATDEVLDERTRFRGGEPIFFRIALGVPAESPSYRMGIERLTTEGTHQRVMSGEVAFDPHETVLSGVVQTDEILKRTGPGNFFLGVWAGGELIAIGAFQVDVDVPESLEVFPGPQPVTLGAGEHVGQRFGPAGESIETHRETLDSPTEAMAHWRATYAGVDYLLIYEGPFAGFWLPESDQVRLKSDQTSA